MHTFASLMSLSLSNSLANPRRAAVQATAAYRLAVYTLHRPDLAFLALDVLAALGGES